MRHKVKIRVDGHLRSKTAIKHNLVRHGMAWHGMAWHS